MEIIRVIIKLKNGILGGGGVDGIIDNILKVNILIIVIYLEKMCIIIWSEEMIIDLV